MTKPTLLLFKDLLDQVVLRASQPDLEQATKRILQARAELGEALAKE